MERGIGVSVAVSELGDLQWRKAVASNATGSCVEVADVDGAAVAVRNSRAPRGVALLFTRAEMTAFVAGVKNGEFDELTSEGY